MSTDNHDTAGDEAPPVEQPAAEATQTVSEPRGPKRRPSAKGHAVSGLERDPVSLAAIVFKNPFARKSLSVHHMQRRLAELGYADAYTDKDGWYGDLTQLAVDAYRRDNRLDGEGHVDTAFLEHLFSDDPNVELRLEP